MNRDNIKKLLSYMNRNKFLIFLSFILAIISIALSLYIPILIGNVVDKLVINLNINDILTILYKIIICFMIGGISQYLMNIINNKIVYELVDKIRIDIFNHLQQLPLKFIDENSNGDIENIIINDVEQMADGLLLGFNQLFTNLLTIFGTFYFMFNINKTIALLVVLLTPLAIFVSRFIITRTYDLFKKQSQLRGKQTSYIEEMITNQKLVQAYGYEDDSQKQFEEINDELTSTSIMATFYSSLTNPSTRLVNALIYALVCLVGCLSIIKGNITIGSLTSFLSYANQYNKPFNEISGVISELQNAFACLNRICILLNEEIEINEDDYQLLENVKGDIAFNNVSFSYDKNQELIKDLSLSLKQGQRVALVGPTGSGKTTLINLLLRFYDVDAGEILIDSNNIKDINKHSLRNNIGMILQDTWIKQATVKDNIALGRDVSDEEIIDAAKKGHAHNFILRLANGYDTILQENGEDLSQGQRQLLCISRLMLNLPPILVLDEATSSIDTRTELKIQDSFSILMQGKTSFIVAHRLSTIKEADLILVMKDGQIIEKGNHDSLIKQNGFYKQLYMSQFDEV